MGRSSGDLVKGVIRRAGRLFGVNLAGCLRGLLDSLIRAEVLRPLASA